MQTFAARAYLENKVMTATTEELQLMLYEGALRFAQQMRVGITERDFERAQVNYERVDAILCELYAGLRPERDEALTSQFGALYNFCQRRLDEGLLRHELPLIDDAIGILNHLRETWLLVMERVGKESKKPALTSASMAEEYEPLAVDA